MRTGVEQDRAIIEAVLSSNVAPANYPRAWAGGGAAQVHGVGA